MQSEMRMSCVIVGPFKWDFRNLHCRGEPFEGLASLELVLPLLDVQSVCNSNCIHNEHQMMDNVEDFIRNPTSKMRRYYYYQK